MSRRAVKSVVPQVAVLAMFLLPAVPSQQYLNPQAFMSPACAGAVPVSGEVCSCQAEIAAEALADLGDAASTSLTPQPFALFSLNRFVEQSA